ncbi:MAG: hypothetical protein WC655_11430 [Candidatus Hydrogenedentales bacterium]
MECYSPLLIAYNVSSVFAYNTPFAAAGVDAMPVGSFGADLILL